MSLSVIHRPLVAVAMAIAIGEGAWLCRGVVPLASQPRPNVVVVTLDTTRADRIGAYGSPAQTPAIDRLAREGSLFEEMSSVAPFTLPAHASIFTGRFPSARGVTANGGVLPDADYTTLAEVLKQHGYATGAFVGSYVLDSRFGLDQGFDTYVDDFEGTASTRFTASSLQRPADEVVDRALTWLQRAASGPFLAWVHFYDPHAPYEPPEPYRTLFREDPYVGEIAFVDAQVGRLLDFLRAASLLDRTVVVVVGDHGESLGEHGETTHGRLLYQSVLRVPLIVRLPGARAAGRRVSVPTSSVDVMPTLLDLLGITAPVTLDGRSLLPLAAGEERSMPGAAYAVRPSFEAGSSDLRMLRSGPFKLIAASRPELYDLSLDPDEQRNLASRHPETVTRMLRRLRELEERLALKEGS